MFAVLSSVVLKTGGVFPATAQSARLERPRQSARVAGAGGRGVSGACALVPGPGSGGVWAPGSLTGTGPSPRLPSVAGTAQALGCRQRSRVGLSLWPGVETGSAEGTRSQDTQGSAAEVRAEPALPGALPASRDDQTRKHRSEA